MSLNDWVEEFIRRLNARPTNTHWWVKIRGEWYVALWKNGEGTKYYDYEQKTVYNSAKHVFQQLNLPITQDNGKELKAGTKDRFTVRVTKCQGNITRVSIRVNFMGDKEYAKLIFKCMDEQLPVVKFDSKVPLKKTPPTGFRLFNKSAF